MFKITEFTICLHCGCSRDVVNKQIEALKPLEQEYKVHWNNRIDRYPFMYESYSLMLNHSVATSPTEWIFFINDRAHPKPNEIKKMIKHLESGFAWTCLYGIGFSAFSKELIRNIGWWDERYVHGGWEDREWVWRLREADLAIYESHEADYDQDWKSPLNKPGAILSTPHWLKKWDGHHPKWVIRNIPEESYPHWDLFIWGDKPEIKESWKKWDNSILNVAAGKPNCGEASSSLLHGRTIIKGYK
jgi:hypothetical protein